MSLIMVTKKYFSLFVFVGVLFCCSSKFYFVGQAIAENTSYDRKVKALDLLYSNIARGNKFRDNGQFGKAIRTYLYVLNLTKGTSSEAIPRVKLMKTYEDIMYFDLALKQVDWLLERSNEKMPKYNELVETKHRLEEKLAAQQRGELPRFRTGLKDNPQKVDEIQSAFLDASYDDKKQFLDLIDSEGFDGEIKKALMLEHDKKFAKALAVYDGLMAKKDWILEEKGKDQYAVMYVSIQRTAQLSGNILKEKEALEWLKENMLPEGSEYHYALKYLQKWIVKNLHERANLYFDRE